MNYSKAIFIREFETLLLQLFKEGKLNGTVHTCVGQEVIPVIIAERFKKGDKVFSNHRGHGHYLSIDGDAKSLLGEMLGLESGTSSGIGGSQHLYNEDFISNGIQGGMTPIAVGYSFIQKIKKNNNLSIVYIGDGTLGAGVLYEALNMASIYSTPTLFVLENNGYAQSTSFELVRRGSIADRVKGFGIEYSKTSIWDIDDLEQKVTDSIEYVRHGKPLFLEVECYRLNSHSKGDDNRNIEEIEKYAAIDPINIFFKSNPDQAQTYQVEAQNRLKQYLQELEKEGYLVALPKHNPIHNKSTSRALYLIGEQKKRINKLINEGLESFLKHDDTLFIGEDIMHTTDFTPGKYGGAFKVSEYLSEQFKGRVFNTPISEAAITGFSIGAALNQFKAIAEIMFGDFLTLCFDQILQQGSKIPEMYGRSVSLPLIIRTPMGGRRGYGPTHSQNIEKHFLFIPNIRVLALNSFIDPGSVFKILYENSKNLTLIIEDKISYTKELAWKQIKGYDIYITEEIFPTLVFTPKVIRPNTTVLCYGGMLDELLACIDDLLDEEIFPEIICPIQISPFNVAPLIESIDKSKYLFIIEEGSKFGALSSEILSYMIENNVCLKKIKRLSNESIIPCAKSAEINTIPNKSIIFKELNNFING